MLEEYASQMEELANQRAEQLKDSERLAAIGQTAGMVGHDIRNPLQAITSDMYLITEEAKIMPDGESKQAILESVDSVNENLGYINKIVSDLQDYTRPLKPNITRREPHRTNRRHALNYQRSKTHRTNNRHHGKLRSNQN